MAASPSVLNYSVLKATVEFNGVAIGNAPEIELTPEFETLDHFSSMAGVKSIDKSVVVSKKLSLRMVMDEWSEANLRLAILGPTSGAIDIFSEAEREGDVVITGTNDVGIKYEWTLGSVSFLPSSSISLISDEWGTMEVTGTVNLVADSFGVVAAVV